MSAAERTAHQDTGDIEPRIAEVLDAKLKRRGDGPYRPLTDEVVRERVDILLRAHGVGDYSIGELGRMAGGASKEQFSFTLSRPGDVSEKLVLRIDPRESIVETCRFREAEAIAALADAIPVPTTRFLDGDGTHLGQPGVVSTFVSGVAKPPATHTGTGVSGLGTQFTPAWRERLVPQFIDNLARIHALNWRSADLPHFQAPTAHPHQAALWQVNWWSRLWREDLVDPVPLLTLTERWLRERLPATEDLVLLHGDYRTGNFLFDPESGAFTAILDWELAHIGDHHEDVAWILHRLFSGAAENGETFVCNLMLREELLSRYTAATGRPINPHTLAFYEVLTAYKLAAMNLGTGFGSARRATNHQDVLLTWLTGVGHTFLYEITRLITEEENA